MNLDVVIFHLLLARTLCDSKLQLVRNIGLRTELRVRCKHVLVGPWELLVVKEQSSEERAQTPAHLPNRTTTHA